MKKHCKEKKAFSFHTGSSPCDFIARIKEEAVRSGLKIEQAENTFDLQLGSSHGGKTVYRANVCEDENGGAFIDGEILNISWVNNREKKKSLFQKTVSILNYIILLPAFLIFSLGYGIYLLLFRLFCGKIVIPTKEEKLCDFMINKMCCSK